jgi:hypothetical protein
VGNVEASAEGTKREGKGMKGMLRLRGRDGRNANIMDMVEGHDYDDDDCPPSKK